MRAHWKNGDRKDKLNINDNDDKDSDKARKSISSYWNHNCRDRHRVTEQNNNIEN